MAELPKDDSWGSSPFLFSGEGFLKNRKNNLTRRILLIGFSVLFSCATSQQTQYKLTDVEVHYNRVNDHLKQQNYFATQRFYSGLI